VDPRPAVGVVAATADYPARAAKGLVITGIEDAEATGALVYHAGTAMRDGLLVTAGGRVLNVVGRGDTAAAARAAAYRAIDRIRFDGMRFRRDIAGRMG
jgi:phosphoribosylamine--glycine ligase